MMFCSDFGIELIKCFEGFMPKIYRCSGGYKTIGYGHRVRRGESFSTLTLSEAHELLLKDVSYVCRGVNSMTNATLLQRQYDVIVSFVFNVGLGAYQRSTLRSKVNRGEHELVQGEFRKWIYIGTQHSKGLIKRRNIEADMYMIAS